MSIVLGFLKFSLRPNTLSLFKKIQSTKKERVFRLLKHIFNVGVFICIANLLFVVSSWEAWIRASHQCFQSFYYSSVISALRELLLVLLCILVFFFSCIGSSLWNVDLSMITCPFYYSIYILHCILHCLVVGLNLWFLFILAWSIFTNSFIFKFH